MSMCVKERERFSVCCFVSCHNHARAQIVLLSLPFLYVVLIHILVRFLLMEVNVFYLYSYFKDYRLAPSNRSNVENKM